MLTLFATWIPTSVLLWSYVAFLYLVDLLYKIEKAVRFVYHWLMDPIPVYIYAPVNEPPRLVSEPVTTPGVLYSQANKTLVKVPVSIPQSRLLRLPWVQCELLATPDGKPVDMQEWLDTFRYNTLPTAEMLQWILAVESRITLDKMRQTVVSAVKIDDTNVRFTWGEVDRATYMDALA